MSNSIKPVLILAWTILSLLPSCKNKSQQLTPKLSDIPLLRGELLLCGSEGFGEVDFSLSCHYEVRPTFDLALSLLHSFEYEEAEKAFVQVLDADPDCAMAYWGVAMSIYNCLWLQSDHTYLEKGKRLLKIARDIPKSELAADYINALNVYYTDWETVDKPTRQRRYENKMEELSKKYAEDTETSVFYALALRAAADPNDTSYSRQKKSGQILEALFKENPNHPGIAHYIIHNYDYPGLAEKALETARRYAKIAPASAHAQHMPSHIFTRLGLWEESISSNLNSASSAVCYAESVNPDAHWTAEIHASDYLMYAYLQQGDNQKAREQLESMQRITDVFPENSFGAAYALTVMPIRMALETKNWEEAKRLELPKIDFSWQKLHWLKAINHFGRIMGYVHTKDTQAAEHEWQMMEQLHQNLLDAQDSYKADQVNVQLHSAKAWIEWSKGHMDTALKLMGEASMLEDRTTKHPVTPGEVLPAYELLGDMLLTMDRPKEALDAYEANLRKRPNRFNSVYGAAVAAMESGNQAKALYYFKALLQLGEKSNSSRPEMGRAAEFIKKGSV